MAAMQTLLAVFSLSYATSVGVDRSAMLAIISGAIALSIVGIPAAGYLSDVIGRKRTMLIASVGCALTIFGYLWVISTTNILLIAIFAFLKMTLFFSGYNGVWTSFFAEKFPVPVRFTGMAVSNQIGNLLAGFAPLVATLLLTPGPTGWLAGQQISHVSKLADPVVFLAALVVVETVDHHRLGRGCGRGCCCAGPVGVVRGKDR